MNHAHLLAIAFALLSAPIANAAQPCAALTKFAMPGHGIVIRQAQEKAGICRVDGVIDERTGRDGKPYGIGFAVASTDSGHQGAGFDGSFFQDQQAALNFLYQAVGEVSVVAKAIVARHYGKPQAHAYFVGCSTGGRDNPDVPLADWSRLFLTPGMGHCGGGDAHEAANYTCGQ